MVTAAAINKHDRLVDRSIKTVNRSIDRVLRDYVQRLTSRLQGPVTSGEARRLIYQDQVLLDELYTVFGRTVTDTALNQTELLGLPLTTTNQTSLNSVVSAITDEYRQEIASGLEEIATALVLAIVAGGTVQSLTQVITAGFDNLKNTIQRGITDLVLRADAAFGINLMKAAGIQSFRYAGGTVSTSRQFCTDMDGRTFTEEEIRRIWDTQTWGGKRPGDPFVVRGGYNCRHYWVPADQEQGGQSNEN
jgi:hypothetical protein